MNLFSSSVECKIINDYTCIVGSVNKIIVTERIFCMRGLWGLTNNSGRGVILKYSKDGRKRQKYKPAFLGRKVIISASILLRKAWLG